MTRGTCKLCLTDADLCKSHYVSRALYTLARANRSEIIMVSRSFAKPTDLQLKKPLLCRHCEEKFCKFGEDYSLSMVNRNGTFKALDMVTAAPPRLKEGNFYTYFGTDVGLDMDALGYFAVSTIWRGAVASWHTSSRTAEAVIPLLCASSR